MSQDGQRLARAMVFLQAGEIRLARRIGASKEHGRFREGPCEIGVANLAPRGAVALPRRCLGACDEATVRHEILHAGEALEVMDFIQQHQASDLADPRDRAQQVERVGVVRLGRCEDGQLHVAQPLVGVANQRAVDCDALVHRGIGKPLADAGAVGLIGNLLANRGQVVLAVGLLDMGESLGSCAHEVYPAPEEITGRAHLRGVDVGLREHAPTLEHRDVLGIDSVVFGFAAIDGFHGEGMTQDEGNTLPSAQVSEPVPREETFHADDEVLLIRSNGLEKRFGSRLHMAVQHDLPVLIQDTEGPWCGRAGRCHHKTGAA